MRPVRGGRESSGFGHIPSLAVAQSVCVLDSMKIGTWHDSSYESRARNQRTRAYEPGSCPNTPMSRSRSRGAGVLTTPPAGWPGRVPLSPRRFRPGNASDTSTRRTQPRPRRGLRLVRNSIAPRSNPCANPGQRRRSASPSIVGPHPRIFSEYRLQRDESLSIAIPGLR
jgi:hypothetical protein